MKLKSDFLSKARLKEALDKMNIRFFLSILIALIGCWFMKLFGIQEFNLDLNNKLFSNINDFISESYIKTQIYYAVTLSIQMWIMYCVVNRCKLKDGFKYSLLLIPSNIAIRYFTSYFDVELGNLAVIIEIIYATIVLSEFKRNKMPRALFINLFIIIYQMISLNIRSVELKAHTYGLMEELVLSTDYYLMLILHKEVAFVNGGTWFFFGPTAWIYRIAGFIVGLFKLHPIKTANEWYSRGKEIENVRKTKKTTK